MTEKYVMDEDIALAMLKGLELLRVNNVPPTHGPFYKAILSHKLALDLLESLPPLFTCGVDFRIKPGWVLPGETFVCFFGDFLVTEVA